MPDESEEVTIWIDGLTYRVVPTILTANQIRSISHPPIGRDRDLWLARNEGADELLMDDDRVAVEDGLRLFTAPRTITAGHRGEYVS